MNGFWLKFSIICALACTLFACGDQDASVPALSRSAAAMSQSVAAKQALTELGEPADTKLGNPGTLDQQAAQDNSAQNSAQSPTKKYLALRHYLQIELASSQMQASFDLAIQHCEALNCELLSASYTKETPYNPPSATLSVRVPPRNINIFLAGLAKNGEVLQHSRESEDKTIQVVDTDARIKNLTDLRDRLRRMLSDKTAKLADVVAIERELADTQSSLDSLLSVRKILSLETDLIAVNIDFMGSRGFAEQGFFAPIVQAFKGAGQVLVNSIATAITFIVGAIPWLLLALPLLILARKGWAYLLNRRT